MSKHTRRPKLDETLKKNEAFELEDGVYVFVKALPEDERKGKLPENDKFVALEGKLFEEIPDEVIMEYL